MVLKIVEVKTKLMFVKEFNVFIDDNKIANVRWRTKAKLSSMLASFRYAGDINFKNARPTNKEEVVGIIKKYVLETYVNLKTTSNKGYKITSTDVNLLPED